MNSHPAITVLLIDPNDVARTGLRVLLAADPRFTIVGETATMGAAFAEHLQPQLIVVDPYTPSGLDTTLMADLTRASNGHICIYANGFEPSDIINLLLTSTDGYLLKGSTTGTHGAHLCDSLVSIGCCGNLTLDRAIIQHGRANVVGRIRVTLPEAALLLTERERTVLHYLAEGRTRGQMARAEGLSPRTVERHVESLKRQLGTTSTVAMAVRAYKLGLL